MAVLEKLGSMFTSRKKQTKSVDSDIENRIGRALEKHLKSSVAPDEAVLSVSVDGVGSEGDHREQSAPVNDSQEQQQVMRSVIRDGALLPSVAGSFYPSSSEALQRQVDSCLKAARPSFGATYKVMCVPHAGLQFSGSVAASCYQALLPQKDKIKTFVIVGPAHKYPFKGIALPDAMFMRTPLGDVEIDQALYSRARELWAVEVNNEVYRGEHSVEVELPFIQTLFPQAKVLPLIVGDCEADKVQAVLQALWGGEETVVLLSTDLSHFLTEQEAVPLDQITLAHIETCQSDKIGSRDACGHRVLAGALPLVADAGLRAMRFDARTSAKVTNDTSRVVGYGAIGFAQPADFRLSDAVRRELHNVAIQTLKYGLERNKVVPQLAKGTFSHSAQTMGNVFVTFKLKGQLRGCIGSYEPQRSLVEDVCINTNKAAFHDPRFQPITPEEASGGALTMSITVLSRPFSVTAQTEDQLIGQLQPDVHGLVLESGGRKALFLPSVWENIQDPKQFVRALMQKAGLDLNVWPDDMQAKLFLGEQF